MLASASLDWHFEAFGLPLAAGSAERVRCLSGFAGWSAGALALYVVCGKGSFCVSFDVALGCFVVTSRSLNSVSEATRIALHDDALRNTAQTASSRRTTRLTARSVSKPTDSIQSAAKQRPQRPHVCLKSTSPTKPRLQL